MFRNNYNSYVIASTPEVTIFGNRDFKEGIKVKRDNKSEFRFNSIGLASRQEEEETPGVGVHREKVT